MLKITMNPTRIRWTLTCVLLALAVYVLPGDRLLQGEVRSRPAQPHFKSGGERSEVLLGEVLATLKKIDQRLERIEGIAQRAGRGGPP